MAFLDALIEAGWGGVPMYLIEREISRNGGVLPRRYPMIWAADDSWRERL
jgi:hypothetical protein